MALVHVTYVIRDDDGDKNSVGVVFDRGALTLAQIETVAGDIGGMIDAITDGVIDEVNIIIGVDPGVGWKTEPVEHCEVQIGALFAFSLEDSDYRESVRIPALTSDLFSGKGVNTANVDVAAFIAAMVDGDDLGGGTVVQFTNKFGLDCDGFIEAAKSVRRK